MAVINTVTPQTSIQNGNIPIDVIGSGFVVSELSKSFSDPAFYTPVTVGGGAVSSPGTDGIELTVTDAPGDSARVVLDDVFPKVFKVSIELDTNILALPATDDAQIFSIRAEDQSNPQTYFDLTISYKDSVGYFARIESWVMNTLEYTRTRAIGPYEIEALRIVRTDEEMTGYVRLGSDWIKIGDWRGFADFTSVISSKIANSTTDHAEDFGIFLSDFKVGYALSVVHEEATILSLTDTEITAVTNQYNAPDSGEVILGLPDGTIAIAPDVFTITQGSVVSEISDNFDMTISVYESYIKPTRSELFTSSGGFTWDEDEFIASGKQNNNLYVPSLWDPRLSKIPTGSLQSGYGFDRNIELLDIKKYRRNGIENWYGRLNHGTFFIRNVSYYLFSDESVISQLGSDTTSDGRSKMNLRYLPKPGVPIGVSTLRVDSRSGNVVDNIRFNKVVKFTGKASNGVELDTDNPANIDGKLKEFKVIYNSNNQYINWSIPVPVGGVAPSGVYSFFLPDVPLFDFAVIFTP